MTINKQIARTMFLMLSSMYNVGPTGGHVSSAYGTDVLWEQPGAGGMLGGVGAGEKIPRPTDYALFSISFRIALPSLPIPISVVSASVHEKFKRIVLCRLPRT
jgi:hypothetical protein